jgi:hypothetical protein
MPSWGHLPVPGTAPYSTCACIGEQGYPNNQELAIEERGMNSAQAKTPNAHHYGDLEHSRQ